MTESILSFGPGNALVGVIAEPPLSFHDSRLPAVVLLNSGLIHRVGPNRLWVRIARRLAATGFTTLRFDLSGIGDSSAVGDRLATSERWVSEVRSAMNALAGARAADRFVLIGNCSGAALSLATALADERVVAAALINPPGKRLLRYYLRLGLRRQMWLRLLHGRARLPGPAGLLRTRRPAAERRTAGPADVRRLAERDVDVIIVSCDGDASHDLYHRRHRADLTHPDVRPRITLEVIAGANHDFTLLANQDRLVEAVDGWTLRLRDERFRTRPQTVRQ
jgi:pimeloyl-ACP methyl ester carboxylesterase